MDYEDSMLGFGDICKLFESIVAFSESLSVQYTGKNKKMTNIVATSNTNLTRIIKRLY